MAENDETSETAPEPAPAVLDPSLNGGGARLDAPAPPEGKPLEASGGNGKVTVRTRYPIGAFEHGLKGVPVITSAGVAVNRSDVKKLLELADANDTRLEEVTDGD